MGFVFIASATSRPYLWGHFPPAFGPGEFFEGEGDKITRPCDAKTSDMVSWGRSWPPVGSQNRASIPPHPRPTGVRPAATVEATGETAPDPQATVVGPVVLLSLKEIYVQKSG